MFFSVRLLISLIMDLRKRNQCTGTNSIKKMICLITSCLTVLLQVSGEPSSSRRPHTFTGSAMLADVDVSSSITSPGAPHFAELIRNVTVPLGREAVLSCVINNLAEYKVGWLRADDQTILSLHRRVVTHNPRVSVTHDESRTWNLHIRQIKESDQGCYMCQINTAVMKKQLGCIQVQVPPDIVDDRSTSDVTVNEGDNVTLTCTATGKPTPRIVWRREDGQKIVVFRPTAATSASNHNNHHGMKTSSGGSIMPVNATAATIDDAIVPGLQTHHQHQHPGIAVPVTRERSKEVEAYHGETLRLYRVTRQMMAAYMCIASNDVPPAVSKRVPLNVNFPPLVTSSMNVVGALLGTDVRLTCQVESHPPSINYWMKGRQQDQHNTILPSAKYSIDGERGGSSSYKTSMTLIIHNFQPQDKSAYVCVAANSLGTAEASIQIYEVARATFGPTPTIRSAISTLGATNDFIINDDDEDEEDEEEEDDGDGHPSTKGRPNKAGVTNQKAHASKKKHSRHQKHETSLSPMSMSPSDEYRDRKQEQRDETADQIRGSSSGAVPRIQAAQSFIRYLLVVFLLLLFAV